MFSGLNSVIQGIGVYPAGVADTKHGLYLVVNIALILGVGLALVSIALSAFGYITSIGDPKSAKKASDGVVWGIAALIICVGAYVIANIVLKLLGTPTSIQINP